MTSLQHRTTLAIARFWADRAGLELCPKGSLERLAHGKESIPYLLQQLEGRRKEAAIREKLHLTTISELNQQISDLYNTAETQRESYLQGHRKLWNLAGILLILGILGGVLIGIGSGMRGLDFL
jgi:hypothetical protein